MDNSNNNQSQFRFMIAAVLSMVVLFGWSYFFAPTRPPDNTNTATVANANVATPTAAPASQGQPVAPVATPPIVAETNPNRSVTMKSPLY